ncbi:MAG: EVE domain-containing protein [Flavobacteriales bacterium]|nr:EVE domain-containing protein [Flavobacteriales bacterium]MCX7768129.1 EVE domain-containing protein [Flavobacteriales bacterium]MDW8409579.1 EVE domain-containing protein [Flavobacteriales bacterium]
MAYYLIKSDPETYSWADLLREGRTRWDGIRNFQARNYLKNWQPGDSLLFYHSGDEKAIVGVAKVVSEPYEEPGSGGRWFCADIEPHMPFKQPVPLKLLKSTTELQGLILLKQSRLSVMPVQEREFQRIVKMGGIME